MRNSDLLDLECFHKNISDELKREDEKSEKLVTLITAMFTVLILSIVYFFTAKIDDNTKIDGEISKGSQVEITYVRKEEAISGRVKLAAKIKVEKQKKGKQD